MRNAVFIYAIFQMAVWIFNGMNLILDPTPATLVNFLAATFAWVFLLVVYLIGKRWAEAFQYLLPVHRLLLSCLFLVG